MIRAVQRLEFANVFPEEEPQEILEYLSNISRETLLKIIGFSTTKNQPNYDRVFSNSETQNDINKRVAEYGRANQIPERPVLISRESSLMLSEIILANRTTLLEDNDNEGVDKDEMNLFKAYLLINLQANEKQNFGDALDNIDRMAEMFIAMSFSSADTGLFEDNDLEFAKLLYATVVKFEFLLEFVFEDDNKFLGIALAEEFGQDNLEDLKYQVKLLVATLLRKKHLDSYILTPERDDHINFLNTLTNAEIDVSDDFTNLKKFPLYKINDTQFSIVDYFYLLDKFFKSVRFILKDAFIEHHGLKKKDTSFFAFYNTEFSEEVVMKKVLDDIFHWKYLVKRQEAATKDNEPDYYVRHNNKIYLFENKDVLVRADIKSSSDIEKIKKLLDKKFIHDGDRHVGIGQLINSIEQIVNKQFPYDDYVNSKNNLSIYPILLVSDRIFEIPGMNYLLNNRYNELVQERLGDKYKPNLIKPLTFIDIDTFIFLAPHLKAKDRNFRDLLDRHHKAMKTRVVINNPNIEEAKIQASKGMFKQLSPISFRMDEYKFPMDLLVDKFRDVLPE
ncbi:MAG: hypothetical protein ACTH5N_00225 [Psychroflexus halocasei]|uniref:hypothetical protein n=1 Tax=Psychroflexus sp. S27 TaxID=1982757 RepID=UPI000C29EFFF|nr:hypothetical protein [Psychroflexus sp. S27]PJX21961.1 hypothetical protein CAP47_10125 [Psychroflexus sp. S27]